jgi:hypothetical protein
MLNDINNALLATADEIDDYFLHGCDESTQKNWIHL